MEKMKIGVRISRTPSLEAFGLVGGKREPWTYTDRGVERVSGGGCVVVGTVQYEGSRPKVASLRKPAAGVSKPLPAGKKMQRWLEEALMIESALAPVPWYLIPAVN